MKQLERELKICKCPSCLEIYSIADWDKTTLNTCNRRSVRRHFKSISNAILDNIELTRVYICPGCGKFIQAKDIVYASNRE